MWNAGPILLFVFQAALSSVLASQPRIIVRPEDMRVPLNSTVRLACRVTVLPNLNVNWIKNGFGMGDTRSKIRSFNSRYSLPDNVMEGRYDLQIRHVRLMDDGKYRCQATASGAPVLSRLATLYVLVPASAPVLRQVKPHVRAAVSKVDMNRRAWVKDGQTLSLECIAKHGRPGASLAWSIDGQPILPESNGQFTHNTITGTIKERKGKPERIRRLETKISTFTAVFNKLHHDKTITCIASNEGYRDSPTPPARTKLEVRYKPQVLIRITPYRPNNTFEENEMITINCEADGRPSSYHWQWKIIRNGRAIDQDRIVESWYRLRVKREMHGQTFRCIAMNYAAGQAQVTIRVKYPPSFVVPGTVLFSASIGGTADLLCAVRSNPRASIEWFRRGSSFVLGRDWKLPRTHIRQSDFGAYICRASAGHFSPIQKTVYLEMRGSPKIKSKVSYGIKGRTGKVLCYIVSVPLPKAKDVLWFRNGARLTDSGRYSMKVETFLRGVRAYLYITRLTASDYGTYNCTVANAVGQTSKLVTFLPQETLSVAFISGLAIAVTVALVIIIIVLCKCRKNSAQRRLYKQAHRQSKSGGPADGIPGKITDEQELVFRPSATVTVASPPILEAPWRNKEALAAATLPHQQPHSVASAVGLAHPLGRYDFDERSVLRNGSVLRYKGIDLSPPPSTLHATIMEEDEAYKEDSARSYDSGYSPGPAFTNLLSVPVSGPPSVSFAQHGLLLPPHSLPLSYVPIAHQHMVTGLRAESAMPTGGGVVNCHSTNV